MSNENGIVKQSSQQKRMQLIRNTVAKGATDEELGMFLELAKASGLNPFKSEIWFIKGKGRPIIMTGINGFYSIANSQQSFDGIETGLIDPEGVEVPLSYAKNDFVGAWAKVYRKDRKVPISAVAMLEEYSNPRSDAWKKRRVMICKCAEALALRKSFAQQLGGILVQEETEKEEQDAEVVQQSIEKVVKPESVLQAQGVDRDVAYQIPFNSANFRDSETYKKALAAKGFVPDKDAVPWIWRGRFEFDAMREFEVLDQSEPAVGSEGAVSEEGVGDETPFSFF